MTWATRRANKIMAKTTPATTPMARFSVATMMATVTVITRVSARGIRRRVDGLTLCQSTVCTATTIITQASAAIGICAITPLSPVTRSSRKTPATRVDSESGPYRSSR